MLPVEGKSSVCLICMKYRIIFFNYYHYQPGSNIIIVYCKHITYARTNGCTHACARTHANVCTHSISHAHSKCASSVIEIGSQCAKCLHQMYDDVVTACVNVVYFLLLNFPGVSGYACPSQVIVSFIDIMLVMLNKSAQNWLRSQATGMRTPPQSVSTAAPLPWTFNLYRTRRLPDFRRITFALFFKQIITKK